MQLLYHRRREIPASLQVVLVGTPLGYRQGRPAVTVLPDESPRRHRGQAPVFRPVGEFQQRILIVPIAVYHHRDCRLSLSPQPGQAFQGRRCHAPSIYRSCKEDQRVLRQGDRVAARIASQVDLFEEVKPRTSGHFAGDPPRSVCRGKINGNDV